jgi:hypothetical protein
MGTHPLACRYKSKADFIAGTFAKLGKVLPNGAQLVVEHLIVKDDQAVVKASFPCDGQKRHEVRQPVLLGRSLRRQGHRPRPRLSELGHGRPPLRREPHLGDAQITGFE